MFVDVIREFITEHSCTLGNESLWSVAHRKYKQMDADGNGTLNWDELVSLFKELNGSKTVSEDEVDYLFCKFDVSENCGIERNEMDKMLYDWQSYIKSLPEIMPILDKYDVDCSGRLERDELRKLLSDLNDGLPVTDQDVDWVL